MPAAFSIVPLGAEHDRARFSCGVELLDRYLRQHATRDIRRRIANCFVAIDGQGGVAGYYTFSAASVPLGELPAEIAKRLPRYGFVPAGLVGRLAVDVRYRGHGLGGALIVDAARRAARTDPAVFALIVDAKDAATVAFYERLSFARFVSRPLSLFLPVATAVAAWGETAR